MSRCRIVLVMMTLVIAGPQMVGCDAQRQTNHQLERVAKDWCMAIRASQVIPVYPLTEDVQPGDVFLVQTPYEDQVEVYAHRGFLPLENLVKRIPVKGYDAFYGSRYGISAANSPPGHWQFPPPAGTAANYAVAPRSAFPTYGFSVSRSEGLNIAVPVQSVPLGLNLLNSASANGTVTIKDSYTYGHEAYELDNLVRAFAENNRDYLRQFGGGDVKKKQATFLRVVNRVYLTKRVDVSLFSNQASGGSASAGVPQPVDLLNIGKSSTNASKIFAEVNKVINAPAASPANASAAGNGDAATTPPVGSSAATTRNAGADRAAAAAAPGGASPAGAPADMAAGGTVKVTMASSRSISLTETFDRPLVIGYLAFDMMIQPDGSLGAPVSTWAQLEEQNPFVGEGVEYGIDDNGRLIRAWLRKDRNDERRGQLVKIIEPEGYRQDDIPSIINGRTFAPLRTRIVDQLKLAPTTGPATNSSNGG